MAKAAGPAKVSKIEKEVVERPSIIEAFKDHRLQEKFHKAAADKLRPKVLPLLKVSNYSDIFIQDAKTTKIDEDVAVAWAEENLAPDVYKSLFVRVFDPNKFTALITAGIVQLKDLPETCVVETVTHKIMVKD